MLYRSRITPLFDGHRQDGKAFWDYTNAASIAQASMFLQRRYPYPKYYVEKPVESSGGIVRRTNSQFDAFVRHLGYEPVDTPATSELKSDVELIDDSQRNLSQVKIVSDRELSPAQHAALSLARKVVKDLARTPVRGVHGAIIPAASDRVTTAGLYSRPRQEVFISLQQLNRGSTTMDTSLHELSHHNSGAEDGSVEHQMELENLGNNCITRVNQGKYDQLLQDDNFTW